MEEEAVADDADEAGGDLVGDGGGDPAGGAFVVDQGAEGVADQGGAAGPAVAEGGVGAAAAGLLDHHGGPVGVLGGQAGEGVGDRAGLPASGLMLGVLLQHGQEQVQLGREVVEDRAPRAAGRLLQPDHGRPLVAVAGEAASRPLEDVGPLGLEVWFEHQGDPAPTRRWRSWTGRARPSGTASRRRRRRWPGPASPAWAGTSRAAAPPAATGATRASRTGRPRRWPPWAAWPPRRASTRPGSPCSGAARAAGWVRWPPPCPRAWPR